MHSEIPRPNADGSPNVGLQLWVDLPKHLKLCEPRYRDLQAPEIPHVDIDNNLVHVEVISGVSHGVESVKELAYTPVWFLDIKIKPGGKITQELPVGWNAFAYVLSGTVTFDVGGEKQVVKQYHNVVFEQEGNSVAAEVEASAKENAHLGMKIPANPFFKYPTKVHKFMLIPPLVVIAGQPLDQPVARYGPFVMVGLFLYKPYFIGRS